MVTAVQHSAASHIVAEMRSIPVFDYTVQLSEVTHRLEFKSEWYKVLVSFTEINGDLEHMWMRSTNWRAEDEPCGKVPVVQAREIYRKLLDNGFVVF